MLSFLRQIPSYRELLWVLVRRDLTVRYKRSILGLLWALGEPLLLMGLFTLVFSFILRFEVDNYPAFVLCGVVLWAYIQGGVASSLSSVTANAALIKKIYFPREILPAATAIGRTVNLGFSVVVLMALLVLLGIRPSWSWLFVPLVLSVGFVLVLGFSLLFSALSTLYEDVAFLTTFAFQALFFLSPVFYPVRQVPEAYREIYLLNPVAGLIGCFRQALLEGTAPDPGTLSTVFAVSLGVMGVGWWVFHRVEDRFAEVL